MTDKEKKPHWNDAGKEHDHRLEVDVKDGYLSIRIGIGRLATTCHEGFRGTWNGLVVTDAKTFAEDVATAMQEQDEIGDSMLTRFLGRASKKAMQDGSIAVAEGDTTDRY